MPDTIKPNPWPRLLAALGLLFLLFSIWSAYRAATRVSPVTDRDYYSHGLKHNRSLLEQKAAESAGWSLTATVQTGRLQVRLSERDGRPVTGADAIATFQGENGLAELPLAEERPGSYAAPLPDALAGEIPAHLEIARDGARISRRLLLNL